MINIGQYWLAPRYVEYCWLTHSEGNSLLVDLHIHFLSGGYMRINDLDSQQATAALTAIVDGQGDMA